MTFKGTFSYHPVKRLTLGHRTTRQLRLCPVEFASQINAMPTFCENKPVNFQRPVYTAQAATLRRAG